MGTLRILGSLLLLSLVTLVSASDDEGSLEIGEEMLIPLSAPDSEEQDVIEIDNNKFGPPGHRLFPDIDVPETRSTSAPAALSPSLFGKAEPFPFPAVDSVIETSEPFVIKVPETTTESAKDEKENESTRVARKAEAAKEEVESSVKRMEDLFRNAILTLSQLKDDVDEIEAMAKEHEGKAGSARARGQAHGVLKRALAEMQREKEALLDTIAAKSGTIDKSKTTTGAPTTTKKATTTMATTKAKTTTTTAPSTTKKTKATKVSTTTKAPLTTTPSSTTMSTTTKTPSTTTKKAPSSKTTTASSSTQKLTKTTTTTKKPTSKAPVTSTTPPQDQTEQRDPSVNRIFASARTTTTEPSTTESTTTVETTSPPPPSTTRSPSTTSTSSTTTTTTTEPSTEDPLILIEVPSPSLSAITKNPPLTPSTLSPLPPLAMLTDEVSSLEAVQVDSDIEEDIRVRVAPLNSAVIALDNSPFLVPRSPPGGDFIRARRVDGSAFAPSHLNSGVATGFHDNSFRPPFGSPFRREVKASRKRHTLSNDYEGLAVGKKKTKREGKMLASKLLDLSRPVNKAVLPPPKIQTQVAASTFGAPAPLYPQYHWSPVYASPTFPSAPISPYYSQQPAYYNQDHQYYAYGARTYYPPYYNVPGIRYKREATRHGELFRHEEPAVNVIRSKGSLFGRRLEKAIEEERKATTTKAPPSSTASTPTSTTSTTPSSVPTSTMLIPSTTTVSAAPTTSSIPSTSTTSSTPSSTTPSPLTTTEAFELFVEDDDRVVEWAEPRKMSRHDFLFQFVDKPFSVQKVEGNIISPREVSIRLPKSPTLRKAALEPRPRTKRVKRDAFEELAKAMEKMEGKENEEEAVEDETNLEEELAILEALKRRQRKGDEETEELRALEDAVVVDDEEIRGQREDGEKRKLAEGRRPRIFAALRKAEQLTLDPSDYEYDASIANAFPFPANDHELDQIRSRRIAVSNAATAQPPRPVARTTPSPPSRTRPTPFQPIFRPREANPSISSTAALPETEVNEEEVEESPFPVFQPPRPPARTLPKTAASKAVHLPSSPLKESSSSPPPPSSFALPGGGGRFFYDRVTRQPPSAPFTLSSSPPPPSTVDVASLSIEELSHLPRETLMGKLRVMTGDLQARLDSFNGPSSSTSSPSDGDFVDDIDRELNERIQRLKETEAVRTTMSPMGKDEGISHYNKKGGSETMELVVSDSADEASAVDADKLVEQEIGGDDGQGGRKRDTKGDAHRKPFEKGHSRSKASCPPSVPCPNADAGGVFAPVDFDLIRQLREVNEANPVSRDGRYSLLATNKKSYFVLPDGKVLVVNEQSKLARQEEETENEGQFTTDASLFEFKTDLPPFPPDIATTTRPRPSSTPRPSTTTQRPTTKAPTLSSLEDEYDDLITWSPATVGTTRGVQIPLRRRITQTSFTSSTTPLPRPSTQIIRLPWRPSPSAPPPLKKSFIHDGDILRDRSPSTERDGEQKHFPRRTSSGLAHIQGAKTLNVLEGGEEGDPNRAAIVRYLESLRPFESEEEEETEEAKEGGEKFRTAVESTTDDYKDDDGVDIEYEDAIAVEGEREHVNPSASVKQEKPKTVEEMDLRQWFSIGHDADRKTKDSQVERIVTAVGDLPESSIAVDEYLAKESEGQLPPSLAASLRGVAGGGRIPLRLLRQLGLRLRAARARRS